MSILKSPKIVFFFLIILVPPKTTATPKPKPTSILKKTNPLYHKDIDLSPLTIPDFVKPRGVWKQAQAFEIPEDTLAKNLRHFEEGQDTLENYEEFRESLGAAESKPMCEGDIFKASTGKCILQCLLM